MTITRKSLPRRTFLRGAGATLALPLLDAMVPAFGATRNSSARPPVRIGFVYVPCGIIMDRWTPSGDGTNFEFAPIMKPLEPFREQLLVLNGLAQINGNPLGDGPGDHARAGATFLTGVHPKKTEGADIHAGISADQIAARELGKSTQLASLEIGLEAPGMVGNCDSGYSCAYTNTISWRTPTSPMPMEVDPRAVFERLFGDGESNDAASRLARAQEDRSILDFVRDDVSRLRPGLGKRDQGKLSEYLDAIRDIERRIRMAESQNVKLPAFDRPIGVPDTFDEHCKLMMDLQVIAFQADLTRVITFMMAREGSNRSYRSIGVPDGHHSVTHHQNDKEKIEKVVKINTHHATMFAYFLEKLSSTRDGDGSLLDHSMIVYGSSISDGNRHTHYDLPIVLAGGGGGQITGGRSIRYPKNTPMTNLLMTMLDKAGVQAEKIGDSTGEVAHLSDV